jgi:hypothetical protein
MLNRRLRAVLRLAAHRGKVGSHPEAIVLSLIMPNTTSDALKDDWNWRLVLTAE